MGECDKLPIPKQRAKLVELARIGLVMLKMCERFDAADKTTIDYTPNEQSAMRPEGLR